MRGDMPKSKTPKSGKPLAHFKITAHTYSLSINGTGRAEVVFRRWHQPGGPRTAWCVDHSSMNVRYEMWVALRPVYEAAGAQVSEEDRGV